ncbi:MAG: DUF1254 domain-containing protein [Roseomonas sp.]|nr:DUF1254 domain-containing protein [Roseomonas sp.]
MLAYLYLLLFSLAICLPIRVQAQTPQRVTVENFARAETDHYFGTYVAQGALGRFFHLRDVTPLDRQEIVRMNRDTLYSLAIIDLDAGPATIELPDTGGRFMSLLLIDQDHYNPAVYYAPGKHRFTRAEIGTRYLGLAVRTFLNPNDPSDVAAARAAQDGLRIEQPGGPGRWDPAKWDAASQEALRKALSELAPFADFKNGFGQRGQVDPVAHLVATAAGWGGNPSHAAIYLPIFPPQASASQAWRMRFTDVPVDGFWSVTVYDQRGFMVPNPRNAVAINNVTARRGADGAVTVQFGGCTEAIENCLPIPPQWNALLRLYRPRAEIIEGRWIAPTLEALR